MQRRPKILVVPLDWGLGHATRCIPIIKELLDNNADVVIAGTGAVVTLLHTEFPTINIYPIKGYTIRYSRTKAFFNARIFVQLPRIFSIIRYEHTWLQQFIKDQNIDAVVSDNRPGLYSNKIPCVYLTHQLQIQTGSTFVNKWVQHLHYKYINNFTACWIPDTEQDGLAGILSHPKVFPKIRSLYLGALTRFHKLPRVKEFDFLLLISGPEPQRSIFEQILLGIFEGSAYRFAVVRGVPGIRDNIQSHTGTIYNHLPAKELNELIHRCEIVISRAGYSTIMDLATLNQKALLVPTPGQKEQEYLGAHLDRAGLFRMLEQHELSLSAIKNKLMNWKPQFPAQMDMKKDVIREWISEVIQQR